MHYLSKAATNTQSIPHCLPATVKPQFSFVTSSAAPNFFLILIKMLYKYNITLQSMFYRFFHFKELIFILFGLFIVTSETKYLCILGCHTALNFVSVYVS
jgi:hypothetical protein